MTERNRGGGPRSRHERDEVEAAPDAVESAPDATPARGRKRAAGESKPPRGKDDKKLLEVLGSRKKSNPFSLEVSHSKLAMLTSMVARRLASEGADAHAEGEILNELYMRHVDAVLGFKSWNAFLRAHWPVKAGDARERQRLAKGCTAQESRFGIKKCLRGIQLVRKLKLRAFADLLGAKAPALPQANGQTIGFAEAKVWQLDNALTLIDAPQPAKRSTADGRAALATTRERIVELEESEPAYKKLRKTVSLQDNEVEIRVHARGTAQHLLAAKFYAALARRR